MSRIDVVVVAYGPPTLLEACLQSLADHPAAGGMSVIVVDNGPGSAVPHMVRRRFPDVEVLASPGNVGFARAANAGIARGRAPLVLVLNPDTAVRANTLDRMVQLMTDQPEIGIAGCRLERADGSFDHAARRAFPTPLAALAHLVGPGRRLRGGPLAQYRALDVNRGPVDAVNGAFMAIRRDALDRVGGFDERYWMYMEDLDLCYRFAAAGWLTWYEADASALHLKGATASRSASPKLTVAFYVSMARFVHLHREAVKPPWLRPAVYGAILLLGVAATFGATIRAASRWIELSSAKKGSPVHENLC